MKRIQRAIAAIALLAAVYTANAQATVVQVYPRHGTVVTTLNKPEVVVHKKNRYYFSDGVWYIVKGKRYVVCAAPVGVKLLRLPRGATVVYIKGRKLYKYRNVWYRRVGRRYVVITPF